MQGVQHNILVDSHECTHQEICKWLDNGTVAVYNPSLQSIRVVNLCEPTASKEFSISASPSASRCIVDYCIDGQFVYLLLFNGWICGYEMTRAAKLVWSFGFCIGVFSNGNQEDLWGNYRYLKRIVMPNDHLAFLVASSKELCIWTREVV